MTPEDHRDGDGAMAGPAPSPGERKGSQTGSRAPDESSTFIAGLFGRGLLYVTVSSLPLVTAVLVSPVLAHLLGPERFGLLASGIALHQVLMALALFGLHQVLVLVRSETGDERAARVLITAGTVLAVVLSLVAAGTAGLWADLLGFRGELSLVLATVSWTVPTSMATLGLALLTAQDRFRAFAVVSVLLNIGSQVVGLALLVGTAQPEPALYAWGGTAGRLLAMGACIVLVRPVWMAVRDRGMVLDALRLGLPIMLSGLSTFVLNSADRLILLRLLGPGAAGRYQIAYTIGFEAITVFAYTSQVWAARFTEVRDERLRRELLGRSRDHLYQLVAPTLLAVNLAAPLLLRVLAPASFGPADLLGVVFLVSLAGPPVIAQLATSRELIIRRRTRPIALATALAAACNIALNLLLVPVLGLAGAAVATAVAFAVQALVQRLAIRPLGAWPQIAPRAVAALVVAYGASAVFVLVEQTPLWIALRCGLALLVGVWVAVVYVRTRAGAAAPSIRRR